MAEGESDTEDGSSSLQVEPQEEETMQLALPLVSLHPPSASKWMSGDKRPEYDHHRSRGSVGPLWNLHSNCRSMSPSEALSMDSRVICHWRQSIGPRASLTCPAGVHGLSISPDGEQLQLGKSLAHVDHPPEEPHPVTMNKEILW